VCREGVLVEGPEERRLSVPGFSLWKALENYYEERQRLLGGQYPHVSCNCAFCDVVRAADLLYHAVTASTATAADVRLLPLRADPLRRLRN
jgi:hypothetical protein